MIVNWYHWEQNSLIILKTTNNKILIQQKISNKLKRIIDQHQVIYYFNTKYIVPNCMYTQATENTKFPCTCINKGV